MEINKKKLDLKQEYLNLGNEQQMQLEIAGLDAVHKAGLVNEEEYQRMKLGHRQQVCLIRAYRR